MKAYVGQTRSRELVKYLADLGIGECTVRGELPSRRSPYFYDNGCYRDFTEGKRFERFGALGFDAVQWERDLWWMRDHHTYEGHPLPDFVVVPDVVGQAEESLAMSREMVGCVPAFMPIYLAVQDGMNECMAAVVRDMREYDGLFVGGTDAWKEQTAARWVQLAHLHEKQCHIGRVGTSTKVKWAAEIGADSIDSCFPLFDSEHMAAFVRALRAAAA